MRCPLILARLTWPAIESFKRTEFIRMSNPEAKLNSYSITVLNWVKSPAIKFKPYMKNKVIEIQNLLPASNWRYVPSNKNKAADLLSKGCKKSELDLIISGPDKATGKRMAGNAKL